MWANYDSVLAQLQAAGLLVERINVDDLGRPRPVRCRVDGQRGKPGWYWLSEYPIAGSEVLLVGAFGVYAGADSGAQKIKLDRARAPLTADERAALNARYQERRRRALALRRQEAARAARAAQRAWDGALRSGESDYLTRKGVGGHGVRYTPAGALLVPMCDGNGAVHGLQAILSRSRQADRIRRLGRDKEYWPAGLVKEGHYHLIGGTPGAVLAVAEGYATAASLHEATGLPVAVAFDAGNLLPVALALHARYPAAKILIGADDDALGKCPHCKRLTPTEPAPGAAPACVHCGGDTSVLRNTGRVAGQAAAHAVDGSMLCPLFAARPADQKVSDWNDLHQREGLAVVRAQVEAHLADIGWRVAGDRGPSRPPEGGGGGPLSMTPDDLLAHYALIYGTETVFDRRTGTVMTLGALRAAAGRGRVGWWLEHSDRQMVTQDQVGFDPTERDPAIACNLWTGWPSTPRAGGCDRLIELLLYLCSDEDDPEAVGDWVLNWLAYPLQHPGAKMQTALLVHGPEGTGKNTFFGAIGQIYGRYYAPISQEELESKFNGWASGKLFVIGNEVVQRAELYHQQGRLKTMVTEPRWVINDKFLPTRFEANHANFVFLSNRLDIARLDRNDRRYCVIWTPEARAPAFYEDVAAEIRAGGIEALHDYLLRRPLGAFSPHSKPPLTRSKRELIELSLDSAERFWRQWVHQQIGVTCMPARADHLYDLYKAWCGRVGIPRFAPEHILLANIAKQPGVLRSVERYRRGSQPDRRTFIFPPGQHLPPGGEGRAAWLTACVDRFVAEFALWRDGRDVAGDDIAQGAA